MSPFRRERRQKTSPFVERISIEVSLNESSLQRRFSSQGHTQGGSAARQTDTKREGRGEQKGVPFPQIMFSPFFSAIFAPFCCVRVRFLGGGKKREGSARASFFESAEKYVACLFCRAILVREQQ